MYVCYLFASVGTSFNESMTTEHSFYFRVQSPQQILQDFIAGVGVRLVQAVDIRFFILFVLIAVPLLMLDRVPNEKKHLVRVIVDI